MKFKAKWDCNDLDSILKVVVDMYFRIKYKAPNYSDTYTRPALEDCLDFVKDRVMYLMCAEVQTEKQELHEWMREQQDNDQQELDKMAQEEVELNDSLNMSLDAKNDRIIRIQEGMDKHDLGDK
jgi:hypothetical protein